MAHTHPLPSPLPTSAAIYLPSLCTTINWKLHSTTTILRAEQFSIKEGLNCHKFTPLPTNQSHSSPAQHCPPNPLHSLPWHTPHCVSPSTHYSYVCPLRADRCTPRGCPHTLESWAIPWRTKRPTWPTLILTQQTPPDHSESMTSLRQTCGKHWETRVTVDLRQISLGCHRHTSALQW